MNKASKLLDWYDKHARVLPWRVRPQDRDAGQTVDPYKVWISEIMLQQTTVAAVKPYYEKFLTHWPTIADLAKANDDDVMAAWAGLGYYARARNMLKCARHIVQIHDGQFPKSRDALLKLPGIGPYTSAAIASIAFDFPEAVMDGNVERVISRLYNVKEPLPDSKPALYELTKKQTPKKRSGDYAQAMMDLGATICVPKTPRCSACPLCGSCQAYKNDCASELPFKRKKQPKPVRFGTAYVVLNDAHQILLERRPEKGLLGGMLGFPSTVWSEQTPDPNPPLSANWSIHERAVRHVFTHFELHLTVAISRVDQDTTTGGMFFMDRRDFDSDHLPNVMKKVWRIASTELLS